MDKRLMPKHRHTIQANICIIIIMITQLGQSSWLLDGMCT